ncbi:hypothetical protein [Clostridium haemolyticum]|uniref:Lipoprotein n=1 Tax=Clostridium haemolyticum NCTC 9693 TaxID=1443114 RepID=A0ABR4TAW4_CLOHA|nr:hypothetical protein [Clostridium haemolyticum]KEI14069.1 hypothetical protein Z960_p0071 [Clostridium haemolyticum NCTC 9693]
MKNKILTLLIGAIIGGAVSCLAVKADTKPKTDYETAIEQINKANDTMWTDSVNAHTNMASSYLLKGIYEEQKKQTDILQKILVNWQK